jgi:hypothetical protein
MWNLSRVVTLFIVAAFFARVAGAVSPSRYMVTDDTDDGISIGYIIMWIAIASIVIGAIKDKLTKKK